MSKVSAYSDLGKIKDQDKFMEVASETIKLIVDTVNGKIEFDGNMKTQTVSVTFTAASTSVTVAHGLNKLGVNYIPVKKTAACDVFNGTGTATNSSISLQGTAASTVTLILY